MVSAWARCVSECSLRARCFIDSVKCEGEVSVGVFSTRARCVSVTVQCEGEVCQ